MPTSHFCMCLYGSESRCILGLVCLITGWRVLEEQWEGFLYLPFPQAMPRTQALVIFISSLVEDKMLEESNMSIPSLPSSVLKHACPDLLVFTVHVLRSSDHSKGGINYFPQIVRAQQLQIFATSDIQCLLYLKCVYFFQCISLYFSSFEHCKYGRHHPHSHTHTHTRAHLVDHEPCLSTSFNCLALH